SLQKKMEWKDKQELQRSLIETHTDIVEIGILNVQGREIIKVYNPDLTADSALRAYGESAAFQEARRGGRRARRVVRWNHAPALELYCPMGPLVMARILVSLRNLGAQIAAERVGGTGFAVLVDGQGAALFSPSGMLDARAMAGLSRTPIVKAALQSQTIGSKDLSDFGGKDWVGAYAPVASVGGAVIMLQQRHEAYLSAIQMRRAAVWVLLIVGACAVLGATLLARQLTLPLLSLTRGAQAVARGDFKTEVKVGTGDELQALADTFNKMTAELHRYSLIQVDRLLAEQRKTEAILFSINDGILLCDRESRVQHANRRVRELLGLDPALGLEGKALDGLLPESPLRAAILQALGDPQPEGFKDVDLSTDKKRRFLRIIANPMMVPGGGVTMGAVAAVRDVTYEKELDKMKEDFLHYITHDLRNPLGSAMGFVDVLLKGSVGVLNPDQHAMVCSIKRSTSRLMGMINNILDIAKMESGKIRLQLGTASLAGICGRSISILESLAAQKNVKVTLDAAEEFSLDLDGDLIERVVTNLLGNAIKFTPKGGAITIAVRDARSAVEVRVEDTGEGIPPEFLDRIFQKFEQVTGQKRGGTGLGLTIARFFIESHLGRIWVESEVGRGSRFCFTIPKGLGLDAAGAVRVRPEA
ncbi:MAG: ATP-binding protein, partial [Elusimicrobia bacterium]|nr:ATP-binding protein [Elusimicrobiota bacterium]